MKILLLQLGSLIFFFCFLYCTAPKPKNHSPELVNNKMAIVDLVKKSYEEVELPKLLITQKLVPVTPLDPIPAYENRETALATIAPQATQSLKKRVQSFDIPLTAHEYFQIIQETSLRKLPADQADVLKRLGEGEIVEILETPESFWWKVNAAGRIGWVKKRLLIPG